MTSLLCHSAYNPKPQRKAACYTDIIIKNKKEKTCTLIDVAIPADRNVVQ